MMRIQLFASILALAATAARPAAAQITVSADDLFGLIGTTVTVAVDSTLNVPVDIGDSGANQTWDFSGMVVQGDLLSTTYLDPDDTPLEFTNQYPDANLAIHLTAPDTSEMFRYVVLGSSDYVDIGSVYIVGGDTVAFPFEEDELVHSPLPIEYGATWTELRRDSTNLGAGYTITVDASSIEVDAWGTLVLPSRSLNALRLRRHQVVTRSGYLNNGTLLGTDTTRQVVSYSWMTREARVAAQAGADGSDPNFTVATEFSLLSDIIVGTEDIPRPREGSLVLSAWPNPFTESVSVALTHEAVTTQPEARFQATVHDLLGRRIRVLEPPAPGTTTLDWDGRTDGGVAATAGIYFIRIANGDQIATRAVIKAGR